MYHTHHEIAIKTAHSVEHDCYTKLSTSNTDIQCYLKLARATAQVLPGHIRST